MRNARSASPYGLAAVLGVVLVLAPCRLLAQADATIGDIVVSGNKSLNREAIVTASGLKVGDALDQNALNAARGRLLAMQIFGMHKETPEDGVQIRAEIADGKARVLIEVDENDQVTGINLSGTGPVPAAEVAALLQTKEGRVLNMGTLRSDVERIQEHYKTKGYTAVVSQDVVIDKGILNVPVIVSTISAIKIAGATKTRHSVIFREMKSKTGDYFNVDQLGKDITRVFNTNLFEDISPSVIQEGVGKIGITLNIQEKRTGTVSVFVGYSSRNSLVGGAEVGEENFLGKGQRISLRWDTGGIANRNSFELSFMEPWLDRRHTSLQVAVYDKTVYRFGQSIGSVGSVVSEDDYYEVHTGGQVTVSRPFGEAVRGYLGLRHDNVRVANVPLNTTDAIALQNGPLTVLNLRGSHNTRDIDLEPATGGYELINLDLGRADLKPVTGAPATGIFGSVTFQKLQFDARRYFSPSGRRKNLKERKQTFALRLMGGVATGTLPFYEQFFVGGAESLRGYNEDRFWGKQMFLSSIEFRAPLAQQLTGVIFADAGDAWGGPYREVRFSGFTQHDGFSPAFGFGFGIRVVTPIGPIRIDQAFSSDGARTHFSIGHAF